MKQDTLEAQLGRSLTSREVTNLKLYLEIAKESLENLLCLDLSCRSIQEERTYESREGYSTLFVSEVFTEVESVTVDGEAVDASTYHLAFFDNRNGTIFNSIVFDEAFDCNKEVVINATWGFQSLPEDVQRLWAQLFASTSKTYSTGALKSKKVEDFSVTYSEQTDEQLFVARNANTIRKYSLCNIGNIKHGRVNPVGNYYGYRI